MSNAKVLKWLTGIIELVLAIPILGGIIVMGSGYSVLGLMFILHLVTLIVSNKDNETIYGSIMGIVTSLLAWIPILGWLLHLISGILLMISAIQKPRYNSNHTFRH